MRVTGETLLTLFSEKTSVYFEYLIGRADSDVLAAYIAAFLNLRRSLPLDFPRGICAGISTEQP
jgi:hypothetical protein